MLVHMRTGTQTIISSSEHVHASQETLSPRSMDVPLQKSSPLAGPRGSTEACQSRMVDREVGRPPKEQSNDAEGLAEP